MEQVTISARYLAALNELRHAASAFLEKPNEANQERLTEALGWVMVLEDDDSPPEPQK